MRAIAQEKAFQVARRNCSRAVGGKVSICDFGEGGVHAIKHMFFAEGFCKSHGAIITMKDLGAFLDI